MPLPTSRMAAQLRELQMLCESIPHTAAMLKLSFLSIWKLFRTPWGSGIQQAVLLRTIRPRSHRPTILHPLKNRLRKSTLCGQNWLNSFQKDIPFFVCGLILSDIANIVMGQSPDGSTYNEEQNGIVFYQGCTDFGTRFPYPRVFTTSPTRFAKAGDILISVRAPVGTLNVAMEDCCIGRGLAALDSKIGSQLHLFYTLSSFKKAFDVMDGNGTTFGSVTKDTLYEFRVIIPKMEIIEQFEQIVKPIEQQIRTLEQENRELTKLRDWLLPMLINGQAVVE